MLNFFTVSAFAADEGQAAGGVGQFLSFAPLIILFAIFYFLLIRPQQKKAKEHREMVSKLEKGDMVITASGIHGAITGVAEGVSAAHSAYKYINEHGLICTTQDEHHLNKKK